ncbi:MFS transporter [Phenylobacterium sp.]|uniref:MFS transporter n=1 Tax=Phenylobacterium sp. TaxID=1871053 RepID=UPI0025E81604|nr:MFS transporter [Phenylobacterium sp.]MBX3485838.1 MFS transporter [Phenylobacterium sp.]
MTDATSDSRAGAISPRIFVLTMCTFAFGSAGFIFAGLLEPMAADLGVSTAVAGQLQTAYVLTSAVLGPVAAWMLGRLDRKLVILLGLSLAVLMHIACAMAPDFRSLMAVRAIAGVAGALSGSSASVAAASLAPPERRGSALAMVTGGMTLAFVVGIPIGSVVGSIFDWRATFVVAAALAGLALAGVLFFLPRVPAPPRRAGGRLELKGIWPLYATSFLTFAANMTLNLYIGPIVRVGAGVTGAGVAAFQSMIGFGAAMGLWLGGRAADRGAGKAWILQSIALQSLAMSMHWSATHHLLPPGLASQVLVAAAIFVAATALFSISPVTQSRLVQMTGGAPVALALNGSVFSMGQALGSTLGGVALASFGVPAIPAAALAMSFVAFAVLSVAFPRTEKAANPAG